MRLAVVTTEYREDSHADVLMARWFEQVPEDRRWGWNGPRSSIASAYVDQFPDNDLARERFAAAGVPIHGSIAAALRCGGDRVAVDGVLMIVEHGDYPRNRYGQQLYPRSEMFHAVCDVLEEDDRPVPIFFDKHLSWDFDLGRLMLGRADRLGVGVLSASSIPFCRYDPPIGVSGQRVDEAVSVYPLVDGGNPESYGYHSVEMVQQVVERRAGGAAGAVEVLGWRGADVWAAAERGDWPLDLYEATWARAEDEHRPRPEPIDAAYEAEHVEQPTQAFRIRYADGLAVTHVGVEGWHEFALAVRVGGEVRTSVNRTGPGKSVRHSNFAALARVAEDWMLDGVEPFPSARALLTCGTLQAMVNAVALPSGAVFPTPHLTGLGYEPAATPAGADHWGLDD